MDAAKIGSLSAETPWVVEEYFAKNRRNQQYFLPSTSTSWCSRMRNSKPRRRGTVFKDIEDYRPTASEVLASFGVTEVGYDSKTPFFLVETSALERVPPNRSSYLRLDRTQRFLDFCDGCKQSGGSSKSNERDSREASEGEVVTPTEAQTTGNLYRLRQSDSKNNFDRLEPCYDWYLTREQELNSILLETRSAQTTIGLDDRSRRTSFSSRHPPGSKGPFLRRPRTASEIQMTTFDEYLVIRKLKLLQRKTDSATPARCQHKVVDDKGLLDSIAKTDDEGVRERSGKVSNDGTLSWTTRNADKGTSSEDAELGSAESQRLSSRSSQRMTSSPREMMGSDYDVVNVGHQDPHMQEDSAILRIASGMTDGKVDEQSNVLGPISRVNKDHVAGNGVSDKEMSISSGYRVATPTGDNFTGDNSIIQLATGSRCSPENRNETDNINARRALQTLGPAPAAATASVLRRKTGGRKMSSRPTRLRCSRTGAPKEKKQTDSKQPIQQKTTPKDTELQRHECRRKKRSRNCHSLISGIDSSVETAVNDSAPIVESLVEQSASCPETPWAASEKDPSADSKLNNCAAKNSDPSSLRRNLIDAALHHQSSFVKLSQAESVKAVGRLSLPVNSSIDTEGGKVLNFRSARQSMDGLKPDKSKQNGRIAFSQRSCRFELPLDMKHFEKLSPQEYLRKYCRISPRRQILYRRIFLKYVPVIGWFPRKDLLKFLAELLGEAICDSDVAYICDLLQITDEMRIDLELFSVTAAVTERLLYPQFVTQHTRYIQDYKKEEIEKADFSALLSKLDGIQVRPEMKRLVDAIK